MLQVNVEAKEKEQKDLNGTSWIAARNGNKLSAVFMIAGLFFGLRLCRFLYLMLSSCVSRTSDR